MADSDQSIFSASSSTSKTSASAGAGFRQFSVNGVYLAANLFKASCGINFQVAAALNVIMAGVLSGSTVIGGLNANYLGLRIQITGAKKILANFHTRNYASLNQVTIADQQLLDTSINNMAAATAAIVTSSDAAVKRTVAVGASNSLSAAKSAVSSYRQCASAQKTNIAAIKKEIKTAMKALNGSQVLTAATVNQVIQLRKKLDAVSNALAVSSEEMSTSASNMTSSLMQLYQLQQIQ
jgi:hypothetical protein